MKNIYKVTLIVALSGILHNSASVNDKNHIPSQNKRICGLYTFNKYGEYNLIEYSNLGEKPEFKSKEELGFKSKEELQEFIRTTSQNKTVSNLNNQPSNNTNNTNPENTKNQPNKDLILLKKIELPKPNCSSYEKTKTKKERTPVTQDKNQKDILLESK
jgi:hypothetical protein